MKKLISVLLILAMLAAMIPAAFVATSAEPATATPTGNWTDEGNYDISWCKTLDSKTSETLEVNGKYYLVYPNWKKNFRLRLNWRVWRISRTRHRVTSSKAISS